MSARALAAARRALAAGWGSAGGAGAAFGLLTLISVFIAAAGPSVSVALRSSALHQVLARAPAADNSVEVRSNLVSFPGGIGQHMLSSVLSSFSHGLARQSIPLQPRAGWAGVTSPFATVAAGGGKAVIAHVRPRLELLYRYPLGAFARLAAGRMPRASFVRHRGGRVAAASLEVAVTRAMAARFGLRPGSRLAVSGPDQTISLTVTGILAPLATRSAFWTFDQTAAEPLMVSGGVTSPSYWTGAAFVGPAELRHLEAVYAGAGMPIVWDLPVAVGAVSADQAQPLANRLTAEVNGALLGAVAAEYGANHFSVSSGLFTALPRFLATQSAVRTVLLLLVASLVVLGAIAVLLGARMLAAERDGHFALLRARGASPAQLAAHALAGCALAAVPAAAAGAAAALALPLGQPDGLSWLLAALAILAALAGPPLIALWRHGARPGWRRGGRSRGAAGGGRRREEPLTRRDRSRRLVADAAVVLACAGGLVVLRLQGLPSGDSANLYVTIAPVLLAAPAALLAARLLPPALRWALRRAARRRGFAAFLGLAGAARGAALGVLPTFGVALALTLVSFGATTRTAIERGQQAAAWRAVGADAVITQANSNSGVTPALEAAVNATPGVEHTAAAAVQAGMGSGGSPIQIVVVDPARYAAVIARTPLPPFPAAALSRPAAWSPGQPAPALASPFAAKLMGRGPATLPTDSGNVTVRVAGTLRGGTAAVPGNYAFVVVPSWAEPKLGPPGVLLIAGRHLSAARLGAVVRRLMPGGAVTLRSQVLASLAGAPLPRSAYLAFAIGAVCAAGLAMLVLLLALALGARAREAALARLATMGCTRVQARQLAAVEAAPPIAAGVAAGVACAAALVPLIAPVIDLTPFTGGSGPAEFSVDPPALAAAGGALALLAALTLMVQTAVWTRRRPARALRAGD